MRSVYLDTSSLVKRYIFEDGSPSIDKIFEEARVGNLVIYTSYWNIGEIVGIFDKQERTGKVKLEALVDELLNEIKTLAASNRIEFVGLSSELIINSLGYVVRNHIYIADALQIASFAHANCDEFLTADKQLHGAALRERIKSTLIH